MYWIVFEAALALAVLLGIVWWTMRARRPDVPVEPAEPVVPADPGARRDPREALDSHEPPTPAPVETFASGREPDTH